MMRPRVQPFSAVFQPISATFRRFPPHRPPISATHDSSARFRPGGTYGSCSPVLPARPPRPSGRGSARAPDLTCPNASGRDGLSGCRGSGASAMIPGFGGRDGCARETGHSGIEHPGRGTGAGPETRVWFLRGGAGSDQGEVIARARWPSENEAATTGIVALSPLHESRILKPNPIPPNQALSNSYG
jgi:hypothetical protein